MAGFSDLPYELHLEILETLTSAKDVLALITASPQSLAPYLKHKPSIVQGLAGFMRPVLAWDAILSMALAAINLRRHHHIEPHGDNEPFQLARSRSDWIRETFRLYDNVGKIAWPRSLPKLGALYELIDDVECMRALLDFVDDLKVQKTMNITFF